MKTFALFLAVFAACALPASAAPAAQRPNVLFVAFDDLRVNVGCFGDPYARTPNIDSVASRGTVFARAYVQQAVCNPSRQSLLSGRRPDSIRVWDLATLFRQTTPDVVPLPEYFKRNGYFAQSVGKIYHGAKGMSDPQSWSVPEQFDYVAKSEDYRRRENYDPNNENFKGASVEFADAPDDEYPDGKVAASAVAALQGYAQHPDRPFFLAVGFRKPHLPFTGPKRFWDMFGGPNSVPPLTHAAPPKDGPALALHQWPELRGYSDIPQEGPLSDAKTAELRRGYYAAAAWADSQLGRVLRALKETGFADNTIIVIWGDHGFHLGELGMWAKDTDYECTTRAPLIVAAPGAKARGTRTTSIVEYVDIYPTLVELCGLPADPTLKLEGRSFARLLDDPNAPGKACAISQFPRPWRGAGQNKQYMGYAVRTPTHRYVEWRRFGSDEVVARELYAYAGDELFETENLANDPRQRALCEKLAAYLPKSPPAKSERDPAAAGERRKKGGKGGKAGSADEAKKPSALESSHE